MKLRLLLVLVLSTILFQGAVAQKSEVGFGIGTFNYTGDLARSYNIRLLRPHYSIVLI
jgi:hypothetical protein